MPAKPEERRKIDAASKWIIYANTSSWYAYNPFTKARHHLVDYEMGGKSTFPQAVAKFEELIGPYYESRNVE